MFTPDFIVPVPVPALAIREAICGLQEAMLVSDEQLELEPVHRFATGLYAREMTLPAGTVAIGHIHGQEHICIISQGRCEVITESGGARVVEAPATFVIPVGTKNCVRALTDCVWTTVHATKTRDIAKLEAELLLPDYPQPALMGEWR